MTSKKNSKPSLRQWVSRIKRYEAELPLLYEKLEYLKVKSVGYNSPSFEPRISSNSSNSNKGIDYWLEKMDDCKRQIECYEKAIENYYKFKDDLPTLNKKVIHDYYYLRLPVKVIVDKYKIKRYEIYELIKKC